MNNDLAISALKVRQLDWLLPRSSSSRHSYPIEIGKILCSMTGRRFRRPPSQLLRQHYCCDPLTVVHSLNHTARRFQRLDPILNGTAR